MNIQCSQTIRASLRQGATLIEFAVSLPVVFVLLFGMIELSRIFMLQHTADTAAYEGARSAIVCGATAKDAMQAARSLLTAAGVRNCEVSVEPSTITEETALVTVRVQIPVEGNGWIGPNFFRGTSVASDVTLLCERPAMVMLTGVPQLRSLANSLKSQARQQEKAAELTR